MHDPHSFTACLTPLPKGGREMLVRAVTALLSLTEAAEPHVSEGFYQVARAGEVTSWREVASLPQIWLNIGGAANRHPRHHYRGYVAVEAVAAGFEWCSARFNYTCGDWCVCHTPGEPFDLRNGSVSRIHSEDCLEHIPVAALPSLFAEFHRVLKYPPRSSNPLAYIPDWAPHWPCCVRLPWTGQGGLRDCPRRTTTIQKIDPTC